MEMDTTLAELKTRYPDAVTFKFGDSETLSQMLIELVRSGKKTATTGVLRDYENNEDMPVIGRRDIALNWDDTPAFVIETKELVTCRFDEVTEDMALAEGENENLAGWRSDHIKYFRRNGGFAEDMIVVWERFQVIEELGSRV